MTPATQSDVGVCLDTFGIIRAVSRVYTYVTFGKPRPKHMTANKSKETLVINARNKIMAQRAESR